MMSRFIFWFRLFCFHCLSGMVVADIKLCGQQQHYTSSSGKFICKSFSYRHSNTVLRLSTSVGTNEWGDDGSGSQCINVRCSSSFRIQVTYSNAQISGNDTTFSATWQWNDSPSSVHSFPNINRVSTQLPLRLVNLSSLVLKASWSMAPENSALLPIDAQGLLNLGTRSNVALDMFLDPDPKVSVQPSLPKYEIMVWIGTFGAAAPIGFSNTQNLAVYRLGGTE